MTADPNTKEKAEKIIESLSRLAVAIEEGMIFRLLHEESLGNVARLGSNEDFRLARWHPCRTGPLGGCQYLCHDTR
jgi:hypothetical protein